ncbi:WD40-repeat-containing domain protein [Entophlyctis helioformis]|nr:WD40-repeat-containing domain protein [Entophlyctis helioformis]
MIATSRENFFESDRTLELKQARKAKQAVVANRGSPLAVPSKVLALELVSAPPADLSFGSNEQPATLAYVGEAGHVARKLNLQTGATLKVFRGHSGPVTSLAVVYDSNGADVSLFTGSWDKTIRKWSTADESQILCISFHNDFVKSLRLFGSHLYSASADKTICKWDADTGAHVKVFRGHRRAVEDIVLSADGSVLFSASSDNTIRKWSTVSGSELAVLVGHETSVYGLALSADECELWSVSADKSAKRWDLETNTQVTTFVHPDFAKSIQIIGETGLIATGCRDENIRIWNAATEKCVKVIEAHTDEVSTIQLASNHTLWTGSLDCTIRSWSLSEELASDATAATDMDMDTGAAVAGSGSGAGYGADAQQAVDDKVDASSASVTTGAAAAGEADQPKASMLTEEEERELAELMDDDDA